ncbi:MAG: hypothetical protein HRU36_02930, partial [Rickettsiales bacterium]|nr:hypothetical protein [Rickettsiales bacterium]
MPGFKFSDYRIEDIYNQVWVRYGYASLKKPPNFREHSKIVANSVKFAGDGTRAKISKLIEELKEGKIKVSGRKIVKVKQKLKRSRSTKAQEATPVNTISARERKDERKRREGQINDLYNQVWAQQYNSRSDLPSNFRKDARAEVIKKLLSKDSITREQVHQLIEKFRVTKTRAKLRKSKSIRKRRIEEATPVKAVSSREEEDRRKIREGQIDDLYNQVWAQEGYNRMSGLPSNFKRDSREIVIKKLLNEDGVTREQVHDLMERFREGKIEIKHGKVVPVKAKRKKSTGTRKRKVAEVIPVKSAREIAAEERKRARAIKERRRVEKQKGELEEKTTELLTRINDLIKRNQVIENTIIKQSRDTPNAELDQLVQSINKEENTKNLKTLKRFITKSKKKWLVSGYLDNYQKLLQGWSRTATGYADSMGKHEVSYRGIMTGGVVQEKSSLRKSKRKKKVRTPAPVRSSPIATNVVERSLNRSSKLKEEFTNLLDLLQDQQRSMQKKQKECQIALEHADKLGLINADKEGEHLRNLQFGLGVSLNSVQDLIDDVIDIVEKIKLGKKLSNSQQTPEYFKKLLDLHKNDFNKTADSIKSRVTHLETGVVREEPVTSKKTAKQLGKILEKENGRLTDMVQSMLKDYDSLESRMNDDRENGTTKNVMKRVECIQRLFANREVLQNHYQGLVGQKSVLEEYKELLKKTEKDSEEYRRISSEFEAGIESLRKMTGFIEGFSINLKELGKIVTEMEENTKKDIELEKLRIERLATIKEYYTLSNELLSGLRKREFRVQSLIQSNRDLLETIPKRDLKPRIKSKYLVQCKQALQDLARYQTQLQKQQDHVKEYREKLKVPVSKWTEDYEAGLDKYHENFEDYFDNLEYRKNDIERLTKEAEEIKSTMTKAMFDRADKAIKLLGEQQDKYYRRMKSQLDEIDSILDSGETVVSPITPHKDRSIALEDERTAVIERKPEIPLESPPKRKEPFRNMRHMITRKDTVHTELAEVKKRATKLRRKLASARKVIRVGENEVEEIGTELELERDQVIWLREQLAQITEEGLDYKKEIAELQDRLTKSEAAKELSGQEVVKLQEQLRTAEAARNEIAIKMEEALVDLTARREEFVSALDVKEQELAEVKRIAREAETRHKQDLDTAKRTIQARLKKQYERAYRKLKDKHEKEIVNLLDTKKRELEEARRSSSSELDIKIKELEDSEAARKAAVEKVAAIQKKLLASEEKLTTDLDVAKRELEKLKIRHKRDLEITRGTVEKELRKQYEASNTELEDRYQAEITAIQRELAAKEEELALIRKSTEEEVATIRGKLTTREKKLTADLDAKKRELSELKARHKQDLKVAKKIVTEELNRRLNAAKSDLLKRQSRLRDKIISIQKQRKRELAAKDKALKLAEKRLTAREEELAAILGTKKKELTELKIRHKQELEEARKAIEANLREEYEKSYAKMDTVYGKRISALQRELASPPEMASERRIVKRQKAGAVVKAPTSVEVSNAESLFKDLSNEFNVD